MIVDRVLIVLEQRITPDGSYRGADQGHMEGPLLSSGLVDNIDILYYGDYAPTCDEALLHYCLEKKPQAVLLSLQNLCDRTGGEPSPEVIAKISHDLKIPTVMFWFDIYSYRIAEILKRYLKKVTLNVILGGDPTSHKPLPLQGTQYVYSGLTYDERLFDRPDGVRDIPVGFHGSVYGTRKSWIEELRKAGISPDLAGGCVYHEGSSWLSYEQYCEGMSRLKIALNFGTDWGVEAPAETRISSGAALTRSLRGFASMGRNYIKSFVRQPLKRRSPVSVWRAVRAKLDPQTDTFNNVVRGKVWEALWCRTFVLEQDKCNTSIYFEPYVDYVPFDTPKDLIEKIRYYLEHDEERDRIRLQGRATVERYYSAKVYWENLFDLIGLSEKPVRRHRPGEFWNKEFFQKLERETSPRGLESQLFGLGNR